MIRYDLTGQQFYELKVIGKAPCRYAPSGHKFTLWNCECSCGNIIQVCTHDLRTGHTTKCRKCASTSHGMCGSRLYNIWRAMKQRCFNPLGANYKRYGGRGITVCDEWKNDFNAFTNGPALTDMTKMQNEESAPLTG